MFFSMNERDLDLFQLEELHSGNGYSDWFAQRIGLQGYVFETAKHSVSAYVKEHWGETDLMVFYKKGDKRLAVLIEDKLSAAFTSQQAQRYIERGEELVTSGEANAFLTVLVAPKTYLQTVTKSDPWNKKISVEDLIEWFSGQQGYHATWRVQSLKSAITKISRNAGASKEKVIEFSQKLSIYLNCFYENEFWIGSRPSS